MGQSVTISCLFNRSFAQSHHISHLDEDNGAHSKLLGTKDLPEIIVTAFF